MIRRSTLSLLLSASLIAVPAARVNADVHGLIGILGAAAILGGASRRTQPSGMSAAQRQQNRDIQTALNYFSYPAGQVDGVIGNGTRGAIRNYEAAMGFPVDGTLNDFERQFLIDSYQRAQTAAYAPPYNQVLATRGPQGLLRTFRDEQLGLANTPTTTPPTVLPANAPAALPSFGAMNLSETASVNSHCNSINVITTTNGGFTTLDTMSDAAFALDEQFCLARNAAVAEANRMMSSIANVSDSEFVSQCEGLRNFMTPTLGAVAARDPSLIRSEVQATLQDTGQNPQQLVSAGIVCLGLGYREENSQMALASALLLVGADQAAYGEIVAHHLRGGFGVTADSGRAAAWMNTTIGALEGGAPPAFLPNQAADRLALLKAAANGQAAPRAGAANSGLPTFGGGN